MAVEGIKGEKDFKAKQDWNGPLEPKRFPTCPYSELSQVHTYGYTFAHQDPKGSIFRSHRAGRLKPKNWHAFGCKSTMGLSLLWGQPNDAPACAAPSQKAPHQKAIALPWLHE